MTQNRIPIGGGSFKSADIVTSGGVVDVSEPLLPIDPDNGPFTVFLGSGMEKDGRVVILTLAGGGGSYTGGKTVTISTQSGKKFNFAGTQYDDLQLKEKSYRPLVFDGDSGEWVAAEYNNFYPP